MRVALIGMGMVAPTHLAAIKASNLVDLAGVYVRDPSKAGNLPVFASVDEIARDSSVDFAILLTPPSARLEIVQTLAVAGKPILMEKPIERTLSGAKEIVAASQTVPTGVTFQHRFRDVAEKLAELISSGALGEIAATEIIVPWWRDQSYYDEPGRGTYAQDGGGVLITQAIHVLDLVVSLLGPVSTVQAMARTTALHDMETEDFVAAGLDFASGVVGSLSATTASFPGGSETIRVHGTKASAELSRGTLLVKWRDGREEVFGQVASSGGGANPMAFTHAWHQAVIEDFAVALSDARPARVTARDALQVHALIEALTRSSAEGRRIEVADV
jgi:UDP-N-acetyl-2-amino-2-deoxyglucuronate dehydrogenase